MNGFCNEKSKDAIAIQLIAQKNYGNWLKEQNTQTQAFLAKQLKQHVGQFSFLPNENRGSVVVITSDEKNSWEVGGLPLTLPEGNYYLESPTSVAHDVLAWGLGAYQFCKYKKPQRNAAILFLPSHLEEVRKIVDSLCWVRDLINTPCENMGPIELSEEARVLAKQYDANFSEVVGDALLEENFPLIHAVGRASDDPPRLVDLSWGEPNAPKLTLVGKGICFDTGGLDIKSAPYMALMKKDMGGAAHALGLAKMIMAANIPVRLRVLLAIAENSVGPSAYRPGDVYRSRAGKTIEIGNTDAEGRLVVADALALASEEKPKLIVDLTTLTGAARVALGPELPAVFGNREDFLRELLQISKEVDDPLWHMPLYEPYRDFLNSPIADLTNNATEPLGGAISAALFLQTFIPDDIAWMHFDMMAWNTRARPGRPIGGEAMAIRALFHFIKMKHPPRA